MSCLIFERGVGGKRRDCFPATRAEALVSGALRFYAARSGSPPPRLPPSALPALEALGPRGLEFQWTQLTLYFAGSLV